LPHRGDACHEQRTISERLAAAPVSGENAETSTKVQRTPSTVRALTEHDADVEASDEAAPRTAKRDDGNASARKDFVSALHSPSTVRFVGSWSIAVLQNGHVGNGELVMALRRCLPSLARLADGVARCL